MIEQLKTIQKYYEDKNDFISANQIQLAIDVVDDYNFNVKQIKRERKDELEHQLYLSSFRIKRHSQNNEFDAVERERYEMMLIQRQISEL